MWSAYQRNTASLVMMPWALSRFDTESMVSPWFTVKFTGAPATPGGLSWRLSHIPAAPATSSITTNRIMTLKPM